MAGLLDELQPRGGLLDSWQQAPGFLDWGRARGQGLLDAWQQWPGLAGYLGMTPVGDQVMANMRQAEQFAPLSQERGRVLMDNPMALALGTSNIGKAWPGLLSGQAGTGQAGGMADDLSKLVEKIRAPGNARLDPPSNTLKRAFREVGLDVKNPDHIKAYRALVRERQHVGVGRPAPQREQVPQSALDRLAPEHLRAAMREMDAAAPDWDVVRLAEEMQESARYKAMSPAQRLGANEGRWDDARQVVEAVLNERGYKLVGASQNYRSLYYAHPNNPSRRIRLSDHPQGMGHAEHGRVAAADDIVLQAARDGDRVYASPSALQDLILSIIGGK